MYVCVSVCDCVCMHTHALKYHELQKVAATFIYFFIFNFVIRLFRKSYTGVCIRDYDVMNLR